MTDSVAGPENGLIKTKWNQKQMLGLAPDVMTARATNRLIDQRRWEALGSNDTFVWGHYARPNNDPHFIAVRLSDLIPVCPCATLKHPCKFVISLLALYAEQPELFKPAPTPEWATEKLATIEARRLKFAPADALQEARAGMDEFGRWLRDQIRHGLSEFDAHSATGLDAMANRLIDAHAPAIAEQLRAVALKVAPRKGAPPDNWPEMLIKAFGRFYLLTQAWGKFDQLSPAEQNDLIQACINPAVRDLSFAATSDGQTAERITDNWLVLGRWFESYGRMWVRRTWLVGERTGRFALIESFISNRRLPAGNLVTGTVVAGAFMFEPSTLGASGRFDPKSCINRAAGHDPPPAEPSNLTEKENNYLSHLARNPWLPACPVMLNQVRLQYDDQHERWLLIDSSQNAIPLINAKDSCWYLLAHSKGEPLTLFAEWSAAGVSLISVLVAEGWRDLIVWGARI